jgi:hypothetical protein
MRALILAATLATLLGGCAAMPAKPWSVVDGEGQNKADDTQFPVTIFAVDGQQLFDNKFDKTLPPGFHYIEFETTKKGSHGERTHQPFALVTAPCKRYLVYAQHDTHFDNKKWQVVVAREEPIGGCDPGPPEAARP